MEFRVAKNTDCRVCFPIMKSDGTFITGATGLDSEFALVGAHGGSAPSFSDCTHEATEIGSTGVYYLDVSAAEVNDDRAIIQVKSSSTGAITQVLLFNTTAQLSNMTQILGTAVSSPATAGILDVNLKNIANAAVSTSTAQLGVNAVQIGAAVPASATVGTVTTVTNAVNITSNADITAIKAKTDNLPTQPKKNVAMANVPFVMVLTSDHVTPATGKTVTVTISKDGAAFGASTNSAAEISSGVYKISLTQAEMNADNIVLLCTAAACDSTFITLLTSA